MKDTTLICLGPGCRKVQCTQQCSIGCQQDQWFSYQFNFLNYLPPPPIFNYIKQWERASTDGGQAHELFLFLYNRQWKKENFCHCQMALKCCALRQDRFFLFCFLMPATDFKLVGLFPVTFEKYLFTSTVQENGMPFN